MVVGSSHGGSVAIWMAALAREAGVKVKKLVLVSPANPWSKHGRLLSRILATPVMRMVFRVTQPFHIPVRRITFWRMYGDWRRVTRETLDGYARHLRVPGTMDYALGLMKNWNSDLDHIREALAQIDVPVLIIWGDKDHLVAPASAKNLQQNLRSSQLRIVDGTGHLPYEEAPEVFNMILVPFLAEQNT